MRYMNWMAIEQNAKRFLNCEVGSPDTETNQKLCYSIENNETSQVMTDFKSQFEKFVP